jgi:hypothetical protein
MRKPHVGSSPAHCPVSRTTVYNWRKTLTLRL